MKYVLRNLVLTVGLACAGHNAMAQREPQQPPWNEVLLAQNNPRGGSRISMAEATDLVQRQTGGRVLNAQPVRQDGRDGYRIKVLTRSGEVRVVFVDAGSGAVRQD